MNAYGALLLYLAAILGFVAITLWMNRTLGPRPAPAGEKLEPFECGATPLEGGAVKALPVKYYALAVVFILFDLETVFLYVWALAAQPLTTTMLATFLVFAALLALIVAYVLRSGLLEDVTR